jgi:hypothetical protein
MLNSWHVVASLNAPERPDSRRLVHQSWPDFLCKDAAECNCKGQTPAVVSWSRCT